MKNYHERELESQLSKLFKTFPVVTITGPRQSGKSTLIKHFISEQKNKWEYLSLDEREVALDIKDDVSMFVKSIKSNIAIDEAQKVPELFHSIKKIVDDGFPHKIILSGSANFLLLKSITESLTGRAGILELLPFSLSEAYSVKSNKIIEKIISSNNADELFDKLSKNILTISEDKLFSFIFNGGYPKLYQDKNVDRNDLYKSYITTYIERDLRDLTQIADLDSFQKIYKLLAFQSSGIINFSSLSSDAGIDLKTVKKHSSILEASYQCKLLNPYLFSSRKRLIKSPKIFFFDTGILNYLYANDSFDMMLNRGQWGAILETFVFSEIYKNIKDLSKRVSIYFWRTSNGAEVDFILENGPNLYPIEVKSKVKIDSFTIKGIKSFIETYGSKKVPFGIVFYMGDRVKFVEKNILCIPLQML